MGSIQSFRKKYGIELLMVSEESLRVGLKAEYNHPVIKKGLEIEPVYITDRLQFETVDEEKFEQLFDSIAKADKETAEIANYNLDSTFDFGVALKMPSIGVDLSGKLNLAKIESFSYEGVKARVIKKEVGTPLIKKLVGIKKNDRKWWRQIDGFNFVEKLYYAEKVVITSETSYAATVAAELQAYNIDVEVKASGSNKSKIIFEGAAEVPFSVKVEVIRDWAN